PAKAGQVSLPGFRSDIERGAFAVPALAVADECRFQWHRYGKVKNPRRGAAPFRAPDAEEMRQSRRRLMASFLAPADTAIRGTRAEERERRFPAKEAAAPIGPVAVRRVVCR